MRELYPVIKKYPFRSLCLLFILFMQIKSYFSWKFIWPLSHKTVMFSRPTEYPFDRLYLIDANSDSLIDTTRIVQRPSKLTFLYNHYYKKDKSYQSYLQKLASGNNDLRTRKVIMMVEKVKSYRPLCGPQVSETYPAACLDRGETCK